MCILNVSHQYTFEIELILYRRPICLFVLEKDPLLEANSVKQERFDIRRYREKNIPGSTKS